MDGTGIPSRSLAAHCHFLSVNVSDGSDGNVRSHNDEQVARSELRRAIVALPDLPARAASDTLAMKDRVAMR